MCCSLIYRSFSGKAPGAGDVVIAVFWLLKSKPCAITRTIHASGCLFGEKKFIGKEECVGRGDFLSGISYSNSHID
jgi:hypothetical protein